MKGLSCFSRARGPIDQQDDEPPRKRGIKRSSTSQSTASRSSNVSSCSNASISKLEPCKRKSDPEIEAMMMPVPPEPRASRCLRLSQPKTYSNIVDSMKASRGCRDWRNFQVFHNDEVDMSISVDEVARKRAADFERKMRMLNSFDSIVECAETRRSSDFVDTIG